MVEAMQFCLSLVLLIRLVMAEALPKVLVFGSGQVMARLEWPARMKIQRTSLSLSRVSHASVEAKKQNAWCLPLLCASALHAAH